MAQPLLYQDGTEIRNGDRVLLHGEPARVELVLDGENNPEDWPVQVYGRAVLISDSKIFGRLFLAEADLLSYEDLKFASRVS